MQTLGERLKRLRTERGMIQTDLAHASGVSYTTISNVENGATRPFRSTLVALAFGLGVDPFKLVEEEG